MKKIAIAAAVAALAAPAFAQQPPRETVKATLGGKSVSIDYGRPALKGRNLDELIKDLPADRMWRAGVNQVTTLTTQTPLSIGGKTVAAGKYSVYVHMPETGSYELVLNKDLGQRLKTIFPKASPEMANEPWPHIGDYTKAIAEKEVARAPMTRLDAKQPVDEFTITLTPKGGDAANLNLAWGDRSWSLDVAAAK